ncbi:MULTISPECIES: ParM/StbA family protein [Desulfitobacterium]|uniref:Plasmid segregation protein ParM n=1 Tax=Desulfitobacterium chlororespirans DSM 11544 TaxID=1121395 RepID=A0A1M7UU00_9FIRM|nr:MULTISPECIES: ParM/StbA family protein [Desulfitobacterium]SHN86366.1 plasmid segregation protein ParM [Desulfitobacterium chlororespirans DSM 11544]
MNTIAENASGLIFAGADIGFGHVKVDADMPEGNQKFTLQSTVATGRDRSFKKWQEKGKLDITKNDLENQLRVMDVEIYSHRDEVSRHYFLGSLAVLEGSDSRLCWDDDKSSDEDSIALLVASLAAAQTERMGGVDSRVSIYVGTGLPLDKFFTHKDSYERNIKGTYTVTFKSGPWEKVKCTLNIIKCRVFPQAWGIFLDMTQDQYGQSINAYLTEGNVLLIDPGFRTTDYALFKDGEFVDAYAGTLEIGVAWAYGQICSKLAEKGIVIDEKVFDTYLRYKDGLYGISGGKAIDLKPLGESAFALLGKKLSEELKLRLKDEWKVIHRTLVGGGGGAGAFEHMKLENKELAKNPQFGNASGFRKASESSVKRAMRKNG